MSSKNLGKYLQSFFFVLKRLVTENRSALLLLLVGVLFPLQIFGDLAEDIWEDQGGFVWDESILLAIRSTARPELDFIATNLTKLGVYWGVFPVSIALMIFLLIKRQWHKLTYLVITLGGSVIINRTVKVLLHRVRPHLWESPAPEFDYGFPSGHAMSSMTFVVALVILTWGSRWCWLVMIFGSFFILAIGWTRLYLGVHYPSDILAGWAASIAWATGVSLLIKPRPTHQKQNPESRHNS